MKGPNEHHVHPCGQVGSLSVVVDDPTFDTSLRIGVNPVQGVKQVMEVTPHAGVDKDL
ncbi:hypothetical protein D3C87_2072620 [compost metagenome]